MSTWMSIGFDPDQMDPTTAPNMQAAMSGARDDAAPRHTGGLDQASPREFEPVSGLDDSSNHWIAGALKHLVARGRTLRTPKRRH